MRTAHLYLVAIVLLHALVGLLGEVWFWKYVPDGGSGGNWMISPAIYWPPLLVLIYLWNRADAKHRQVIFPAWGSLAVTALFPVGVPFYYFRTNELRRALFCLCMFLLFVGVCIAAVRLGNKLAFNYYAIWTNK